MPLSRHLAQGRLLYFTHKPDAISISENDHLRWMAFDNIVQSVIRKNKPQQLTLPHQWALMMPLLNCTPTKIIEFGLGAGNHLLFLASLHANIQHQVIESSKQVIDLALEFFALTPFKNAIINQGAQQWLDDHLTISQDWIIFDIYQKAKFRDNSYNQLLSDVIDKLPSTSILSINFPDCTEKEMKFWLIQLANKKTHNIHLYSVPHFKNQIMHLIPKQKNISAIHQSPLPNNLQRYWHKYQLQFGLKTNL